MPSFDGGHYFLTALIPVRTDLKEVRGGVPTSHADALRTALTTLPTALQTPACIRMGLNSPFARNDRTHFTRLVVIEDVMYNGRDPQDALLTAIKGPNPVIPQPVDHLNCPFLMWSVDFDPRNAAGEGEPASYLRELWGQMEPELRAVFGNCLGFDQVADADGFARYIIRCQLETTMPFNDYWITAPPLPSLSIAVLAGPAILAAVALVVGLAGWAFGWDLGPWLAGIGAVGLVGGLIYAYALIMRRGAQPFPAAPNSDLRSVLKALYLQRHFTDFIIDQQGKDATTLHLAFGAFLAQHRPADLAGPTQPPGVVGV